MALDLSEFFHLVAVGLLFSLFVSLEIGGKGYMWWEERAFTPSLRH